MAFGVTVNFIVHRRLKEKLKDVKGGFRAATVGAVQRTRKEMTTWAAREIRQRVAYKHADLVGSKKRGIKQLLTSSRPTKDKPTSKVVLKKSARPSLKLFGLKQKYRKDRKTGRYRGTGISYRMDKTKGRQTIKTGFGAESQVWPKLYGHAFVREGKKRFPISKLHGVSPWGIIKINKLVKPWKQYGRERIRKNLEHQVRYRLLKAQGKA